ncbi:MAG TPA: hypothetical protein VKY85_01410 [Candidatus Angelobacter sp.]|nr:hypothetical protein [Candidatus Angelobacter sp.]
MSQFELSNSENLLLRSALSEAIEQVITIEDSNLLHNSRNDTPCEKKLRQQWRKRIQQWKKLRKKLGGTAGVITAATEYEICFEETER